MEVPTAPPAVPAPGAPNAGGEGVIPASPPTPASGAPPAPPAPGVTTGGQQPGTGAGVSPPGPPATSWQPPTQQEWEQYRTQLTEYQRQAEQLRQLEPYARMGYQAYLQQQQADRQRQLQEEQQRAAEAWVKMPEFRREWLDLIDRDPQTGELRVAAGGPPDLLSRHAEFQKAYQQTAWDLVTSPEKVLAEPIRREAARVAQQLIQQHLGTYQSRVQADQILAANQSWMVTPQGQLTPDGQQYARFVAEAERRGVAGVAEQHEYAVERLELAQRRAGTYQQPAAAQGDAAKAAFLRQAASGLPGSGPATPPPAATTPAAPPAGRQPSLKDMLGRQFAANGITDQTISSY